MKKSGIVAVWRYEANTRNYPGFHLTADADGCTALKERVAALERGTSRSEVLRLSPPTQPMLDIPNNQRGLAPCIAQGRGDYRIGSRDQCLWFWWFPATKRES